MVYKLFYLSTCHQIFVMYNCPHWKHRTQVRGGEIPPIKTPLHNRYVTADSVGSCYVKIKSTQLSEVHEVLL